MVLNFSGALNFLGRLLKIMNPECSAQRNARVTLS